MVLCFAAGLVGGDEVALAVGAIPLIICGQRLGMRAQPVFSGRRFDRLVYGLLFVSGLSVGISGLLA